MIKSTTISPTTETTTKVTTNLGACVGFAIITIEGIAIVTPTCDVNGKSDGVSYWLTGGQSNAGIAIAVTVMAGLAVAATIVYSNRFVRRYVGITTETTTSSSS
nr:hypothetical protein [Tanacetum cinerariifolium]